MWVCLPCGKEFSVKSNATRHVRNIHLENERIQCEICNELFKHKNSLGSHMIRQHKVYTRNVDTGCDEQY